MLRALSQFKVLHLTILILRNAKVNGLSRDPPLFANPCFTILLSFDNMEERRCKRSEEMAEGLTLYKLMILYMLRKVNFPLSNTQITEFILDREYTDYFHVQQAINDLADSKLITVETIRNTSMYTATIDGEKTLEYFSSDISYPIKKEIDKYLSDNAFELRNESCMLADWEQTEDGGYAVHCRVREGKETIIDLTINVTTAEEAERVCERWPEKSQEIYVDVMTKLL